MKRVILYTRVSTDDQAIHGFSLRHQLEVLKKICEMRNYTIVQHFQDDYSAKDFNRPEYQKLELFVRANKKDIDLILFTRWDRFSRNSEAAFGKLRFFKNLGVEVNSVEQPLDLTIPDQKFMLAIYLISPEIENDKNSLRTTEGSRKARKEGCWTGPAPYGYSNTRNSQGKSTLVSNDNACFVKESFELLARGVHNSEQVRKMLNKEGMPLHKQAFLNMIRNTVYIGKILIKEWKKEPAILVDGLHEAIVDEELFYKVQKILDSRNRLKHKPKKKVMIFL